MPKPVVVPTWATDATYTTGPVIGSLTKVDPGASIQAEGHVPATPASAQRSNWWKNLTGAWAAYLNGWFNTTDEIVYPVLKTRQIGISPLSMRDGKYLRDGVGVLTLRAVATEFWRPFEDAVFGLFQGEIECTAKGLTCHIDITPHLRSGMVLTGITAWIKPDTASALAANRMVVRVYHFPVEGGPSTLLGADTSDATNTKQGVSISLGSHVVALGNRHYSIQVRSSQDVADKVYGFYLNFQEPAGLCGPRNF